MTDGPTERASVGYNPGKIPRSIALETEDATCEFLLEHSLCCCQQALAALAFAQQCNPIEDFCLGDGSCEEVGRGLFGDPRHDVGGGLQSHQLRDDIRVENNHSANSGTSRTESRGGN